MSRDDIPTRPVAYGRGPDFEDTLTPEEFYSTTTRGLLDDEFSCDVPRARPTLLDRVIVVSVFGAGLGVIWYGIGRLVRMFGG